MSLVNIEKDNIGLFLLYCDDEVKTKELLEEKSRFLRTQARLYGKRCLGHVFGLKPTCLYLWYDPLCTHHICLIHGENIIELLFGEVLNSLFRLAKRLLAND